MRIGEVIMTSIPAAKHQCTAWHSSSPLSILVCWLLIAKYTKVARLLTNQADIGTAINLRNCRNSLLHVHVPKLALGRKQTSNGLLYLGEYLKILGKLLAALNQLLYNIGGVVVLSLATALFFDVTISEHNFVQIQLNCKDWRYLLLWRLLMKTGRWISRHVVHV